MPQWRHAPILVAACALALLSTAAWPFTVDDAFILARYADRIARGLGYTYRDGVVSDGVTGPLWLVPLVLSARLGFDPAGAAKWLGMTAGAAALVAVVTRVCGRARGGHAGWLAAGLGCTALPFVVWSVAGLETGAAALCAAWMALSVTRRPRPSPAAAGVAGAALCWLRPELVPFAAALLIALGLRTRGGALRALAIACAGGIAVVAFRLALFGHALPMSASAKPALLAHGADYVGEALLRPRALVLGLLAALALRDGGRDAGALLFALAVEVVAIALAGGDWMPGRRLFAPVVPVLALALALGMRRFALRRPCRYWALCAAALVLGGLELAPELREARRAGLLRRERAPALARPVCAARGPVAMIDIGLVGHVCRDQTFVDLGGLTEPAIAFAPGGHLDKRIAPAWLRAHAPGLFVLHSRERPRIDAAGRVRWFAGYPVERRVLASPFVQRHYRAEQVIEYAPHYFYLLLTPRLTPPPSP